MDKKQPEAQERKFWKRLCALNRFSFFYMGGGVARASDKSGNWIEVHSAQEIVDDAECEVSTQHARITELESQLAQRFDAADMATAAAQGFRDGAAKEQQAGWQPIETAPANGQCLVWCDTDDGGEVMKLCRDKKGNWLYEGEPTYATSFYIEPTHWRELPPPPSSAQREVGNANS